MIVLELREARSSGGHIAATPVMALATVGFLPI
jgi:hypothetical protein